VTAGSPGELAGQAPIMQSQLALICRLPLASAAEPRRKTRMHPHTSTALTKADGTVPYLDALAEALSQRGWIARVAVSPSLPARVSVQHAYEIARSADVLAARDGSSGSWWYWFSWAERIMAADDPGAAADAVIGALSAMAGSSPGEATGAPGSQEARR
jgi:hypothetical protein